MIGGSLTEVLSRGAINARAATQATWLRRAMDIVFNTVYMRFGERTYKQTYGFPMDLPLCPDAANLFKALIEDLHGEWQNAQDAAQSSSYP